MQIDSSEEQDAMLTSSLILNSLGGEEKRLESERGPDPRKLMHALARWLAGAGRSCGALAAKRRRSLLSVPGDTTPITLSVGADYLWKPFSLTRAGDVSVSRAHSGRHRTSLPHAAARLGSSQSEARVGRDVAQGRGGFGAASRGVLRQVYFRLLFFLLLSCFFFFSPFTTCVAFNGNKIKLPPSGSGNNAFCRLVCYIVLLNTTLRSDVSDISAIT